MELTEYKCKNCGMPLDVAKAQDGIVCCEYCGSKFAVPQPSPEALSYLRMGEHELDGGDFNQAYNAFSKAADVNDKEPEAYWGMALAEAQVRYIKDKVNNRLQPICYDVSSSAFSTRSNVKKAISLATPTQKEEYKRKAEEIDYIRQKFNKLKSEGIDYDCFICVKVTAEDGRHTEDSHIADNLYHVLTKQGYRPFYSERETLGITGDDYEALILYALHRVRCMIIVCGDESYLRTPWVMNEYMRFIELTLNERKEYGSLTIMFSGSPIEKLPNINGKIQGINANSGDAFMRAIEFVNKFKNKKSNLELKHKTYANSNYEKKSVARQEIQKRTLAPVGAQTEVSASDKARLKNAEEFLSHGDFKHAQTYAQNLIANNPSNSKAYWILFLAENQFSDYKIFEEENKKKFIELQADYAKKRAAHDDVLEKRREAYNNKYGPNVNNEYDYHEKYGANSYCEIESEWTNKRHEAFEKYYEVEKELRAREITQSLTKFENLERAIACANKDESEFYYDSLPYYIKHIMACFAYKSTVCDFKYKLGLYYKYFVNILNKSLVAYKEYIVLPDSKNISELTDILFGKIIKCASSSSSKIYLKIAKDLPTHTFETIIKTVTDTDKYIDMTLKFARLYNLEYCRKVLEVDEGNGEALTEVFFLDGKLKTDDKIFKFCSKSENFKLIEEKLFSYGFNRYAFEKLYNTACEKLSKDTVAGCRLIDFLLSLLPEETGSEIVSLYRNVVYKLMISGKCKFVQTYTDRLIAINKFDHEAHFIKCMAARGINNPAKLVKAKNLIDDANFSAALDSFAEKFPKSSNVYLEFEKGNVEALKALPVNQGSKGVYDIYKALKK